MPPVVAARRGSLHEKRLRHTLQTTGSREWQVVCVVQESYLVYREHANEFHNLGLVGGQLLSMVEVRYNRSNACRSDVRPWKWSRCS